ncbi:MAG: hypothetical protein SFU98_05155 [Leptospiraceae bacterium]|nr:hypothetical protein [Leptospiraceae bacterium]
MTTLSIEIPDDLKPLLDDLDYQTHLSALKVVALKNIKTKEKKITELMKKDQTFSTKYKLSFEEFNKNIPEDFGAHEDWIDWSYTHNLLLELESSISKYKFLFSK